MYKIIKEYLWSVSQKQDGFFLIYYKNNILYKMQSIVLFIWFKVFYKIIGILYIYITKLHKTFINNLLKFDYEKKYKLSFFFLGKGFNGLSLPK